MLHIYIYIYIYTHTLHIHNHIYIYIYICMYHTFIYLVFKSASCMVLLSFQQPTLQKRVLLSFYKHLTIMLLHYHLKHYNRIHVRVVLSFQQPVFRKFVRLVTAMQRAARLWSVRRLPASCSSCLKWGTAKLQTKKLEIQSLSQNSLSNAEGGFP